MDEWLTDPETILTKVKDLASRAQAHPGDPAIAKEIQDFSLACCMAWQPQYDRLCVIIESQRDMIQEQTTQIYSLAERIFSLVACLERSQTFRIHPGDSSYASD